MVLINFCGYLFVVDIWAIDEFGEVELKDLEVLFFGIFPLVLIGLNHFNKQFIGRRDKVFVQGADISESFVEFIICQNGDSILIM